jgi:hypothetical protein
VSHSNDHLTAIRRRERAPSTTSIADSCTAANNVSCNYFLDHLVRELQKMHNHVEDPLLKSRRTRARITLPHFAAGEPALTAGCETPCSLCLSGRNGGTPTAFSLRPGS